MEIVKLHENDEKKLIKFLDSFHFKNHVTNNNDFLVNPMNYLIIAYEEDKPVGFLMGYELERPETKRSVFFIYDLEVLEAHRRKGLATRLIDEFKKACYSRSGSEIFVLSNASNVPAVNLYCKTGGIKENDDDVMFVYDYEK